MMSKYNEMLVYQQTGMRPEQFIRTMFNDGDPSETSVKATQAYMEEARAPVKATSQAEPSSNHDVHKEAADFANGVVQMVRESAMHKSLTFAAVLSAIANAMADVLCDDDVQAIRQMAAEIRRNAIV
jgi:hypothetical protein